jgi:hypothetical protein
MKHATLFALAFATALVAVALIVFPSCIGPFFETPADWKTQRETMRRSACETVVRYEKLYGELPVEDWPEERHRQTYRNAKRILVEMDGKP